MYEVLSTNPSANVFVCGDFNVFHKDWLTYSGETNRLGELCYNFSISNDLIQMVYVPASILGCDSHDPSLLDLLYISRFFLSLNLVFLLLVNFLSGFRL